MTIGKGDTHSFDWKMACKIGVEKAILVGNFHFWIGENERRKSANHFHKGEYWTYATGDELKAKYPYFKASTMYRWLKELTADGWLKVDKFNQKHTDQTTWYARGNSLLDFLNIPISQNEKSISQNENSISHSENPSSQNENSISQNEKCIYKDTDNNSDNNTDNKLNDNDAQTEILEVETEEIIDQSGAEKKAPPVAAAPPETDDEAELIEFTTKLQTDRRLLLGLHRQFKLPDDQAADWIEKYVLSQWTISNLKNRFMGDLLSHCQLWIKKQLELGEERQKRDNQLRQHGNQTKTNKAGGRIEPVQGNQFGGWAGNRFKRPVDSGND